MVEIRNTLVSLDLFGQCFCCDLGRCLGRCCVEGDEGAPAEIDEVEGLEQAAEQLQGELTPAARRVLDKQGVVYVGKEGNLAVSIVGGRECVFAVRREDGTTLCAIDRAHREGRFPHPKPLSCALYPARISQVGGVLAVNYHRWDVCQPAREHGRKLQLPVYQFLKEPLLRAFGQEWWDECCLVAGELRKQGYID